MRICTKYKRRESVLTQRNNFAIIDKRRVREKEREKKSSKFIKQEKECNY